MGTVSSVSDDFDSLLKLEPLAVGLYLDAKNMPRTRKAESLSEFEEAADRLEKTLVTEVLSVQERIGLLKVLKECNYRLMAETGLPFYARANPNLKYDLGDYHRRNQRLNTELERLGAKP